MQPIVRGIPIKPEAEPIALLDPVRDEDGEVLAECFLGEDQYGKVIRFIDYTPDSVLRIRSLPPAGYPNHRAEYFQNLRRANFALGQEYLSEFINHFGIYQTEGEEDRTVREVVLPTAERINQALDDLEVSDGGFRFYDIKKDQADLVPAWSFLVNLKDKLVPLPMLRPDSGMYNHDLFDHGIGYSLLPPTLVERIAERAQTLADRGVEDFDNNPRFRRQVYKLLSAVDNLSFYVGRAWSSEPGVIIKTPENYEVSDYDRERIAYFYGIINQGGKLGKLLGMDLSLMPKRFSGASEIPKHIERIEEFFKQEQ